MTLKEKIKEYLMSELNNIVDASPKELKQFILGDLGQINSSSFVIQRFGDPDTNPLENWYEVISESFTPVVANTFDAVHLSDNQFAFKTFLTELSFLIQQEDQGDLVPIIEQFIEFLIGKTHEIDEFTLLFEPQDIQFRDALILNDVRFIEFALPINIELAQDAVFGNNFIVQIKKADESNYTTLDFISYVPVKNQQTQSTQLTGTNLAKSVVQSAVWVGSIEFFIRKSYLNETEVVSSMIDLLESDSVPMNQLYNLRITNPITTSVYNKTVLLTAINMPVLKGDVLKMSITLEEANTEVL